MFLKFLTGQRDECGSTNAEESTNEMSEREGRSQAEDNGSQVQNDIVPTLRTMIPVVYALERWRTQIDTQHQHNRD